MFRGGPVDSRGTGITSGLMDGGQIGGGAIYGEPNSDGRYGFKKPVLGASQSNKYLDFLKSQNLESIVEPAEKEFQEKVMIPFRETKKTQREPVISGLNELINQFSTKKYDSEEIL